MRKLHFPPLAAATLAFLIATGTAPVLQAADYTSTVMALDPVGYWHLDETATVPPPRTFANAGSAGDVGTGYGVLDLLPGEEGIVGNAIRMFNAGLSTAVCGSKVDVPWDAAWNPEGSFTLEFWAKPTALPAGSQSDICAISSLGNDASTSDRSGWMMYMAPGAKWDFRVGALNSYAITAKGSGLVANQWQHVVAIYDGQAKTANLYVNGVRPSDLAVVTTGNPYRPNPLRPLRIGGTGFNDGSLGGYSGNRGFDGWIDEVAFYQGVLSAERVAAHYDKGTNDKTGYGAAVLADNPVGYWKLDEPAYTAPDPGTLPATVNAGSAGAAASGVFYPGTTLGVEGPACAGMAASNKAAALSGVVGRVAIPDAEALDFTGQITIMAWVKPTSKAVLRNIVTHGSEGADLSLMEVVLRINQGKYEVGTLEGVAVNTVTADVPDGDIGNWVFLAGTWDESNGWRLYRHGEPMAANYTGFGAVTVNGGWGIGARGEEPGVPYPEADGRTFQGAIDEVAIFSRALTPAEIKSIFDASKPLPIIIQAPKAPAGAVYAGDTVVFEVTAEGTPPLTYQWTKNGAALPGRTSPTLTLGNVTAADSGTYAVEVSNANGKVASSVELVVISTAPEITRDPASATRYAGAAMRFSVGVTGSAPLSYQWKLNGTPIPGAVSAEYVLDPVRADQAGSYTCTVSNAFGEETSAAASFAVLPAPAGYAAQVLADNPMAYWRLGETSGAVAYDFWGGLDAEYRAVALGQDGFSFLDPDKAVGTSAADTYVGGIDGTVTDFSGATATFTIEAWVKGPPDQLDGAGIIAKGTGDVGMGGDPGTEQFCLAISSGVYSFFVRQDGDFAMVSCDADVGPNGTWQHLVGVYDGENGLMSFYVNGVLTGGGNSTPNVGVRPSIQPVSLGAKRGGVDASHDLYFTGTIDEVAIYKTALAEDRVWAHFVAQYGTGLAPTIQVQPVPVTAYVNMPAKLSAAAAGSQPMSYQWKKNGVDVPGATTDTLNFAKLQASDAGRYTLVVQNSIGSVTSDEVVLTVLALPTADVEIPGLVAHWKFENNLTDDTGRGNNGTAKAQGTPPPAISYVDGKIGSKALRYETNIEDPANVRSCYVELGVRPDLQFGADQDFSVAFWVQVPYNYVGGDLPFLCNAVGSANTPGYTFAPSFGPGDTGVAGGWGWSLFDNAAGGINVYGAVGSLNDGQWHHLVFSFDRQGLGVTYLDSLVVDSRLITSVGSLDTGNQTCIGQDPTGLYAGFEWPISFALLDDLGIFRRALTPLEATAIYAAGLNGHSFVNKVVEQPTVTVQMQQDGTLRLQWEGGGTLQQADQVTGGFTDIAGAASPHTVSPSAAQKFYRVRL